MKLWQYRMIKKLLEEAMLLMKKYVEEEEKYIEEDFVETFRLLHKDKR